MQGGGDAAGSEEQPGVLPPGAGASDDGHATQRNIALFGLCECEQRLANYTRASRYCEEALKYDEQDPYSYFVLGKIYSQLFNRDKRRDDLVTARRYYARVVEINPAMKEAQAATSYIAQIDRLLPKLEK